MRSLLLVLVMFGCGGGASILGPEPKVEIRTRRCNVESTALLVVNVTYTVTLDVGQAFEATVNTGGQGTAENSTFSCPSWNHTMLGNDDLGCQRDSLDDPETNSIDHFFNATLPDVPAQFSVALLGSALDEPLSDIMVANDSESIDCAVPPNP